MTVCLVKRRIAADDMGDLHVIKVFSDVEKAKQYIETTFDSHEYIAEDEVWRYDDESETSEVRYEEWEVL